MQTRALVLAALVVAAAATPLAGRQAPAGTAASRISITDFKKAFDAGTVVVLDVRDPYSYAEGHIPGAVLVPLDGLAKKAAELKAARKTIVTYCA
jgi:rhodanese-related sulfurtransferase